MATTKKTSKAKSKTAKKPAAKKTTSAARSTKATTSKKTTTTKKVEAVKVSKKAARKPADRKTVLRRLNLTSAVLGLVGALAAGLLMNRTSYQFLTGLLTVNPITGGLAPAVHAVWDVELRWIVVGILVISSIVPLLAATRNRKKYEAALDNKVMAWRWIDTAVVGGLIMATIALLSGVQDIMTLVVLGGLVAISAALSLMSEKQNAGAVRAYRGAFSLSMLVGALPWLLVLVYALGTLIWGMTHNNWVVYVLYVTTLLCGMGAVSAQRAYVDRKADYDVTERRYLLYSIGTKVTFALLLILGFKK